MERQNSEMIFTTNVSFDGEPDPDREVAVREVINDDRRRLLEISIRAGGTLKRHRAAEPITVLCMNGEGRFYAGAELEESVEMFRGSLVALDPDVDHEVTAATDLRILVTRFK